MKGLKFGGNMARLAGREAYLLVLQERWPSFWHALNVAWRTPDRRLMPAALEQWAREFTRHEPWITEMVNATLAYWDQNPRSPEARLAAPTNEQWFVYWRPHGPAELFKPDPELMRRARITAYWVSGTKDEAVAAELGEGLDRVKKARQRFIRLIGLGERGLETWWEGKLIESRHHPRPMRKGANAPFIKPPSTPIAVRRGQIRGIIVPTKSL